MYRRPPSIAAGFVMTLTLFGFVLAGIRSSRTQVTITSSQVEVTGAFRSHTIPFAEISGFRLAAGKNVRGIYLYRRGKSRVFVRESSLQLDDFYERWKASIYDLEKAARLKRKAAGKQRPMDWCGDDTEQHPAIGGPDVID
jgi:hypothetical protein